MKTVLRANNIKHEIVLGNKERVAILSGVNLTVHAGEAIAIIGRSGSGKTTLLSQLGLLAPVSSGQLEILSTPSAKLSDVKRAKLRNSSMGFVFQSYSLVPHFNAYRNVELPLRYGARVRRRDRRTRVKELLELVGLSDRARSKPRHLSGGEQQRVAIARALVRNPALIFADEPTGALDEETADKVLAALLAATRHQKTALVIVTHDAAVARQMDRQFLLHAGQLQEITS